MLVACGPLLLPTGVCVCHAAERGGGPQALIVDPPSNPPAVRKNRCCSKCVTATVDTRPVAVAPESPRPARDHLPGCPASPTADSLKWVDPTPHLTVVLALPVVTLLTAEPAPSTVRPAPVPARRPSAPPLYLSHCALVI
jgi:hypothetical protein